MLAQIILSTKSLSPPPFPPLSAFGEKGHGLGIKFLKENDF
jgi:hypothetical protein